MLSKVQMAIFGFSTISKYVYMNTCGKACCGTIYYPHEDTRYFTPIKFFNNGSEFKKHYDDDLLSLVDPSRVTLTAKIDGSCLSVNVNSDGSFRFLYLVLWYYF